MVIVAMPSDLEIRSLLKSVSVICKVSVLRETLVPVFCAIDHKVFIGYLASITHLKHPRDAGGYRWMNQQVKMTRFTVPTARAG